MINKPYISIVIIGMFFLLPYTPHASEFKNDLVNGKLQACPSSPNCINSEDLSINPINIPKTETKLVWSLLQQVITEQGGNIQSKSTKYLSAIFISGIFGFIDDIEARIDLDAKVIHLRSASRVGYYDFGVNGRRLKAIKKALQLKLYEHQKELSQK